MVQTLVESSPVTPLSDVKCVETTKSTNHPRIEDLRAHLLQYAQQNPNDFQPTDVELIKTTELWLNRFLNHRGQTYEQATKHAIDAFKWRKEFEVGTVDLTIVPIEGWLSGAMFIYLPDREGLPVMYLRARMHFRVEAQFYKLLQQLIVYNFTQLDRLANKEFGWSVLLDLTGIGWANVDLEMLHFLVSTMRNNFPNGCRRIIVYGLPWFLNILARTVLSALPSDTVNKIKFVSGHTLPDADPNDVVRFSLDLNQNRREIRKVDSESTASSPNSSSKSLIESCDTHLSTKHIVKKLQNESLYEYIARENLPDFLGGTADVNYRLCPTNAISARQILTERFAYTDEQIVKTLKPFQKIIEHSNRTLQVFKQQNYSFEWSSVQIFINLTAEHMKKHPTRSQSN